MSDKPKIEIMASIFRDSQTSHECITCKENLSYIKEGVFILCHFTSNFTNNLAIGYGTTYHNGDLWFCSDTCTEIWISSLK